MKRFPMSILSAHYVQSLRACTPRRDGEEQDYGAYGFFVPLDRSESDGSHDDPYFDLNRNDFGPSYSDRGQYLDLDENNLKFTAVAGEVRAMGADYQEIVGSENNPGSTSSSSSCTSLSKTFSREFFDDQNDSEPKQSLASRLCSEFSCCCGFIKSRKSYEHRKLNAANQDLKASLYDNAYADETTPLRSGGPSRQSFVF